MAGASVDVAVRNLGAVLLEVGARNPDRDAVDYPDIDLMIPVGTRKYVHKDGTPYPPRAR